MNAMSLRMSFWCCVYKMWVIADTKYLLKLLLVCDVLLIRSRRDIAYLKRGLPNQKLRTRRRRLTRLELSIAVSGNGYSTCA